MNGGTSSVMSRSTDFQVQSDTRRRRLDFDQKVRAGLKVPRILHRTSKDFTNLTDTHRSWHDECKHVYEADGWEVREWNDEQLDTFVRQEFPERYDRFREMEPTIRRIDAVRYLWMYKYGGIYLDMDGECVRSASEFVDALPEGSTAWNGGFPEPFFMMGTTGNEFWLYAFDLILNTWRHYNVRDTGGPFGLNRMLKQYVNERGKNAVRLFALNDEKVAEFIFPPQDVIPFQETRRWFVEESEFPSDNKPDEPHKVGFIPNQIIDPTACMIHHKKDCRDSHCHEVNNPQIRHALFVHHCHESWGGEAASMRSRFHPKKETRRIPHFLRFPLLPVIMVSLEILLELLPLLLLVMCVLGTCSVLRLMGCFHSGRRRHSVAE
jgi:hypothetical protein